MSPPEMMKAALQCRVVSKTEAAERKERSLATMPHLLCDLAAFASLSLHSPVRRSAACQSWKPSLMATIRR